VRIGQPAQLRLAGFSWTEYGVVEGVVARVGGEVRDGRVRVELDVHAETAPRVPAQHGLAGTLEVEVERASPASLLLRSAGHWLTEATSAPKATPTAADPPRAGLP
jgi:hypothetical protein